MRIGYCTSPENAQMAARCGFEAIECSASALSALSEEEFERAAALIRESGLPSESCNILFPGGIHLIGDEADPAAWDAHLARTFSRLAALNVKTVVFGSGGARRVPETITMADAREQLYKFSLKLSDAAEKYGLRIAAEPLNFRETNILVTEEETHALVKRVDHKNFRLLLDNYHYAFELKPLEEMEAFKEELIHFHISAPWTRFVPLPGDGFEEVYRSYFKALRTIGYDGLLCVEAKAATEDELKRCAEYLFQFVKGN